MSCCWTVRNGTIKHVFIIVHREEQLLSRRDKIITQSSCASRFGTRLIWDKGLSGSGPVLNILVIHTAYLGFLFCASWKNKSHEDILEVYQEWDGDRWKVFTKPDVGHQWVTRLVWKGSDLLLQSSVFSKSLTAGFKIKQDFVLAGSTQCCYVLVKREKYDKEGFILSVNGAIKEVPSYPGGLAALKRKWLLQIPLTGELFHCTSRQSPHQEMNMI